MASTTVLADEPEAIDEPTTRDAQEREFERRGEFGLDVTRLDVSRDASLLELMNDCECLWTAALAALDTMTDHAVSESSPSEVADPWWAMLYTMRHARAVFTVAYERAHELNLNELSRKAREIEHG